MANASDNPESHDRKNPISRILSKPNERSFPPSLVEIIDLVDVRLCVICHQLAVHKFYGIYCCGLCALDASRGVTFQNFPREECQSKNYTIIRPSSENQYCRGLCKPCRAKKVIRETSDRAREMRRRREDDCEGLSRWKMELLQYFIDDQAEHFVLEYYGGKDYRTSVTSMQHLTDAFEISFKKLTDTIRCNHTLRDKMSNADRTALVRAYASQHFVYEMLRRSQKLSDFRPFGVMELDSKFAYVGDNEQERKKMVGHFCEQVIGLLKLVKKCKIDDEGYAYLKAISFFNKRASGLENKELVSDLNKFFKEQFRKNLDRKEEMGPWETFTVLRKSVTLMAGALFIAVGKTHTEKSDLMKELLQPQEFTKGDYEISD